MFQHGLMWLTSQHAFYKKSACAIDHIITNPFLTNEIKTGILLGVNSLF